jgi:energy-coupling factor transporter ATP-binding protein EcfA2
MIKKANALAGVYGAFRKQPLMIEELAAFYQDTKAARGENPRSQMARLLRRNADTDEHILFVGHRGCGKSTELNHLQKDIQDTFLVINFSVFEELDPSSLNYMEIFIVAMEKLIGVVKDYPRIKIKDEYLETVKDFIKIVETEKTNDQSRALELEVGVGGSLTIPMIFDYFTKFKGSAKNSVSFKKVLKERVEPNFATLVNLCNDLISAIRLQLKEIDKEDIVIIIEDLDKVRLSVAKELFYDHAVQVTGLRTNVIYTYPNALHSNLNSNEIRNNFSITYELPMIKVNEKDGAKVAQGYTTMKAVVAARMDLSIFEDEKLLDNMIQYSGGSLRDLFHLVVEAAENALDDDRTKIGEEDWIRAYNRLKNDYKSTIADEIDAENKVVRPAKAFYDTLIKLKDSKSKTLDNTQEEMILRQNSCILTYNGEKWYDVHPMVKDILTDREKG